MSNKPVNKTTDSPTTLPSLKISNDGASTKSNAIEIPSISLPKGGGALKGIDEKFQVNASNGTASFSIPLPITPSRGNFQPALTLGYNSGVGNSIFGAGWGVDFPSIQRRTDKRLPQYKDDEESDVFLFSGAEDLVPVDGEQRNTEIDPKYDVSRYIPRIEGLFARIEKIKKIADGNVFWKVTTKENVVTFFGMSEKSRIQNPNPAEAYKIFKWLPELSYDDKGDCMVFSYKTEDKVNIEKQLHEKNRLNENSDFTNKYLKNVKYGNKTPYFPHEGNANIYNPTAPIDSYMFEVVFDFGEHRDKTINEDIDWKARKDAYSECKAGFEIRTYRLCERVLMFHDFSEIPSFGTKPKLVRSLDLKYRDSNNPIDGTAQNTEITYLEEITQNGYNPAGLSKSLPKMTFNYQPLKWSKKVYSISKENIVHAPVGLGNNYQWVDFWGEGISGILTEQADAWYYKSNLGNGEFSQAQAIVPKPSLIGMASGNLSMQDIDANGKKYIVSNEKGLQGYFELDEDDKWQPFKTFDTVLNIDTKDPNVRLLDLNGDGIPEVVMTEENVFRWFPSKGTLGYDYPELATKPFDEEKGPAIVFADSKQSIFLADMTGDGLTDIVRIRNSDICYWSNLGYGKFGAKVSMSKAPTFDYPDLFNPSYLHLSDVSGTGVTDIVYLGQNKFKAYLNLSGNAWSDAFEIEPFWNTASPNQISVVDLLGKGTGCIVWSSPLPANSQAPMRYIDLMGGTKPHIMVSHTNGMGKETVVEYKSSTEFYLADKKAGHPWITKLPFPVQCVSKLEIIDTVSDARFTNKYSYHHGYYDHAEKEFRGFGRVDQTDTEEFEYLKNKAATNATDIQFHEPPLLTKTWFHTGAFIARDRILDHFKHEYWSKNEALPDGVLPKDLTAIEYREALRACKGMTLRQEVFSLDGSTKKDIPYSVATHNCHVQLKQKKGTNAHAVFMVHESEAITFSYERNSADPRVAHTLNLEFDEMGNVKKSVSVVYGRTGEQTTPLIGLNKLTEQQAILDAEQRKVHLIYTESEFTDNLVDNITYRLRMPLAVKTYELHDIEKLYGFTKIYTLEDFKYLLKPTEIPDCNYESEFTENKQKRLIEHIETRYLADDLISELPRRTHGRLGLPFEAYQLAYTPALVTKLYGGKVDRAHLEEGKFCHLDDDANWWIRSGKIQFDNNIAVTKSNFYQPTKYTDPFGTETNVELDYYKLFPKKTSQGLSPLLLDTSIKQFNYHYLVPEVIKDANDNLSEAKYDALGLLVGTALKGKAADADDLDNGFEADLTQDQINAFFNDPIGIGPDLLKNATSRLVYDFETNRSKVCTKVGTIVRETHVANENGTQSKLQYSFEYTDGMGKSVLKKVQAEIGEAYNINDGVLEIVNDGKPRWVGNGHTILNNKGKAVRQYEPYFSTTHLYENEPIIRKMGVSPELHYDAAGRLVRTDFPDGTYTKVEYDAWQQKVYDQNDNVVGSDWERERIAESPSAAFEKKLRLAFKDDFLKAFATEKIALEKTLIHNDTPTTVHTDSLGRPFYSVAHNKWEVKEAVSEAVSFEECYATYVVLDIEGNNRAVIDARYNTVMTFDYDMLGHIAHTESMDAGERWLLNDCMGKPCLAWDSKDQRFETKYDILHRPTESIIKQAAATEKTFEIIEYGTNKTKNENGQILIHKDTAGIVQNTSFDFKGNVLETSRTFCKNVEEFPNWAVLSTETFLSSQSFDALNRPTKTISPHSNIDPINFTTHLHTYNEANLLEKVEANIRQTSNKEFVKNIDYDAKGQRTKIEYGNNTQTIYQYDPDTFRLRRLTTTSNFPPSTLQGGPPGLYQDLLFTYDPVGNIINIEDKSQKAIYFNNSVVEPINIYRYDATYRLIEAKGREHAGITNLPSNEYDRHKMLNGKIPSPNDGLAMRHYTQRYEYDAVGNMEKLKHNTDTPGTYTRTFINNTTNNQLLKSYIGSTPSSTNYTYDEHGNMKFLSHLPNMTWNFKDQLMRIGITASNENDNSKDAQYAYDASGQRVRKIVTKGITIEERLYLGDFEIFRVKDKNTLVINQELESQHILDDKNRIVIFETKTKGDQTVHLGGARYQYSNHLGTACLELTDAENTTVPNVISYEEYHPYGSTAYQNQNTSIRTTAKRYRYTGMERDEESGLNYHTARYYAPCLCRWTAADPIGIGDGVNDYVYVKGNPIIGHDKNGKYDTNTSQLTPKSNIDILGEVPTLTKAEAYARMALDVESTQGKGIVISEGWMRVGDQKLVALGFDPKKFSSLSGLKAALYSHIQKDGKILYVLAFNGTDELIDWQTNFAQSHGKNQAILARQYFEAMALADKAKEILGLNLEFTGSSLGGGLASAAATVTGLKATTFNAAGLNADTISFYKSGDSRKLMKDASPKIDAYYANDDLLSGAQDSSGGVLPAALGERIRLNLNTGHSLVDLIQAIRKNPGKIPTFDFSWQ
ncbi:MAG: SpvB/TcaC N-terminal domain-containing protein [Bacteroidota bacterium]